MLSTKIVQLSMILIKMNTKNPSQKSVVAEYYKSVNPRSPALYPVCLFDIRFKKYRDQLCIGWVVFV